MVYLFLAPGFEESEAVVPADLLRQAEVETALVSLSGKTVSGSHGITVEADLELPQVYSSIQPVPGHEIVQDGKIGIFSTGGTGAKFLLGLSLCFLIIELGHNRSPFLPFLPANSGEAGVFKKSYTVSLGVPRYL